MFSSNSASGGVEWLLAAKAFGAIEVFEPNCAVANYRPADA
jgi:hypothetical protein